MITRLLSRLRSISDTPNALIFSVFMTRVIGAAIAYICQILLARWISPHDNGLYVQYMSALAIILCLVTFGFESSVQYFIPLYKKNHDYARLNGIRTAALIFSLNAASGLVVLATLVALFAPFEHNTKMALLLSACIAIPWSIMTIQGGIARCWNWMQLDVGPQFMWRFLCLAIFAAVGIFWFKGANFVDALIATLIATCVTLCIQSIIFYNRLKPEIHTSQTIYNWKE